MNTDPCPWGRIAELEKKATQGKWAWRESAAYREHVEHQLQGLDAACENVDEGRIELVAGTDEIVLIHWAHYTDDAGLTILKDDARLIAETRNALPSMLRDRAALLEVAKAAARVAGAQPSTREYLDAIGELRVAVRSAREAGAIVSLGAPEPPTRARISA